MEENKEKKSRKKGNDRLHPTKTRGGEKLSYEQVREIEIGRKKLRKQMKKQKIRSRREFELTASSLGLYFDKHRRAGLLLWLFHGRLLAALIGAILALLFVFFIFSLVTQLRGHFTINLSDNMFRNGFMLSEDEAFTNPTTHLYSEPVENVPCISIVSIPEDVDMYEGSHNGDDYFAYTFFLQNGGEDTVDFIYELTINSESQNVSSAAWVMLFVDGEQTFYAQANDEGESEALPALSDNRRGYREAPMIEQSANPNAQYQVVASSGATTYYRILPEPFESQRVITSGICRESAPNEIHKYTVVMWLEGDDPDCVDELIGGHLGIEMSFRFLEDDAEAASEGEQNELWYSLQELRRSFKENLIFLED